MKNLISGVLLIMFFAVCIQAQPRLHLTSRPIENDLLATILALSEMKELKPPRPTDGNFFLRLYSLDDISNTAVNEETDEDDSREYCAPGVETEVVCGYRYFLAVHDGSLGVTGTVYDLGLVGEITSIEWLKSPNSLFDRLRVQVANYPSHAFKANRKLVKQTQAFELTVNMNSLEIKESER